MRLGPQDPAAEYVAIAATQAAKIVAVLDTHLQADHVSGMTGLVARTGATPHSPESAGVELDHHVPRRIGGDGVPGARVGLRQRRPDDLHARIVREPRECLGEP